MVSWKILLWFVSIYLTFISSFCQETTNIVPLGSNITAGTESSHWLSSSGDFAFGFYHLNSTGLFLVGIWFDKIPDNTLVWSANRDDPVHAGSKVNLMLSGRLVLTDTNGREFVLYNGTGTSHATMQDDGNFVLKNSSSGVLWESFDFPTDTILPGQYLDMGQALFSSANGTVDYSTGKYRLEMQTDGNVVLSAYRTADIGYWNSITENNKNVRLVFDNTSDTLFITNGSLIISNMTLTENLPDSVRDYYHRAMITDKGDFQQLFHRKVNGSGWNVALQVIVKPCIVNNICGVYGFCQSPDNKEANCSCLPGYSPRDQYTPSKGCYPNEMKDFCDPNSSLSDVYVERISNADFPNRMYAELERVFDTTEELCRQEVLNDCLCEAAVFNDSTCFKKRMPIQNARSINPDTNNMVAFLKISNSSITQNKKHSVSKGVLVAGVTVCSVLAPLFAAIAIYYHPFVKKHRDAKTPPKRKAIEMNLRAFSFQQLHKATNGFKNKLGQGASGAVYSGILKLEDEEVEVAVKKLGNGIEQGDDKEFLAEVRVIGLTHHKNLVHLIGFCNEKSNRLVYELMKNGAVSNIIFRDGQRPSWKLRSDIVLDIARGLLYLHEECENQIIHCDIKPQNILLDENYVAKIADFGIAKLLMKDQTRTNTNFRGTMGYMAPEWLKNVPVTTKVDIYSFGVLLLEIIFCQRHMDLNPIGQENEEPELILVDWVLHCMRNEKLRAVASLDEEIMLHFHNFERMTMVGLWCLCPEPNLRPSAAKLVQMLEGTIELGVPPMVDTTI